MNITCFANDPIKGCMILTDNSFCGANCPFHKTVSEVKAARKSANQRLANLPEERQKYIAENYYSGKHPWKGKSKKEASV